MSIRIHQLAKQLELSNLEVIRLLRERGLDINSPSNTIPTIYADALIEELSNADAQKIKQNIASENDIPGAKSVKDSQLIRNNAVEKEVSSITATEKKDSVIGANTSFNGPQFESSQHKTRHNPLEDVIRASKLAKTAKEASVNIPKQVASIPQQTKVIVSLPKVDATTKQREDVKSTNRDNKRDHDIGFRILDKSTESPEQKSGGKVFLKRIEVPVKQAALKPISIKQPIIVRDLADQMSIKPFQLISKLMSMGIFASMNQSLDPVHAQQVAERFGFLLSVKQRGETENKPKIKQERKISTAEGKVRNLSVRPPIVCVLGHVDHGKTTLLDIIRKTNVAKGEVGGITQRVAAYQVQQNGKKITFIDTPGHAAFSKMRERGANLTDIAVLVVAADDGFMPQTDEALSFTKKANIPVIVAINKVDAKGANVDRVKQQMQQRGITSEDWGGETLCMPVSALNGTNITNLLELILLQAEMMELQADASGHVSGTVLESQMEVGRGPTASAIIQDGTLKIGNCVICGTSYCKVRTLIDDSDKPVKDAPPSTPLKIVGWTDMPMVGDIFTFVENEKAARRIVEENILLSEKEKINGSDEVAITDLDQLFSAISAEQDKVLNIIIRSDVHGSAEALEGCLLAIDSKKIKLKIIASGAGSISKNDIELASTTGATIVAFNTKFEIGAQALAKNYKINIIQHNVIYEIIEQVRDAMADLLEPELHEQKLGAAEVRKVFALKTETIAGCMVVEGKILRDHFVRIIRKKTIIFQGKFESIKHLKEDVAEVRAGFECGIKVSKFDTFEEGDIIECFEIKKIQSSL